MINHHPDTEVLTDYAAGSLAFGHSLCVAVHLENCEHCQQRAQQLSQVGAELMHQLKPATVGDDLLASVLGRLDSPSDLPGLVSSAPPVQGVPRALSKLVPNGLDAVAWKRVTSSLQTAILGVGDDTNQVALVRIQPGGRIPEHRHGGAETTVVLRGGFSDQGGNYGAGDFVTLGEEDSHQPIAHQNSDCICLTAQNAPLQFTGFFSKWANPFISINPQ
jgi:putative transcriptional regulator